MRVRGYPGYEGMRVSGVRGYEVSGVREYDGIRGMGVGIDYVVYSEYICSIKLKVSLNSPLSRSGIDMVTYVVKYHCFLLLFLPPFPYPPSFSLSSLLFLILPPFLFLFSLPLVLPLSILLTPYPLFPTILLTQS